MSRKKESDACVGDRLKGEKRLKSQKPIRTDQARDYENQSKGPKPWFCREGKCYFTGNNNGTNWILRVRI